MARGFTPSEGLRYPGQGVADSYVEPAGVPAGGTNESVVGRQPNISATTFRTGDMQRIVGSETKSLNLLARVTIGAREARVE